MNDKKIRTKESIKLFLLSIFCLIISALSAPFAGIDDFDNFHRILAGVIAAASLIMGIYLLIFACRIRRDDVKAARAVLNLHEEDLKNKFINRSYMPKAFWNSFIDEMRQMPLPDTAAILRRAREVIAQSESFPIKNKKHIEKLTQMADDTEKILVWKIFNEEFLYVLEDIRTRSAVLASNSETDDDCIMIFYKPLLKSQYIVKVPKDEIENYLFVAFTLRGAQGLIVYGTAISAEKLIPKIDYSKIDEAARPVKNPDLMRSFNMLALLERPENWGTSKAQPDRNSDRYTAPQDADYEITSQNTDDSNAPQIVEDKRVINESRIKARWDELRPAIKAARFLLPIKKIDAKDASVDADACRSGKGAHIVSLDAGTTISIPTLVSSTDETRLALPIFSDWYEYFKLYSKESYDAWILEAEDLAQIRTERFVLNAGGICYELPIEKIHNLLDADV